MCAGDCDGTLEHQRNTAPRNVAEWITQWKNSRGTDGKKIVKILKSGNGLAHSSENQTTMMQVLHYDSCNARCWGMLSV